MATAQSHVKRALRLLGLIQSGEEPTAEEAVDGLAALNSMLHQWRINGVPIDHIDVAWTEELALPDDHDQAVTYALAMEIAPEFGTEIPQVVALKASRYYTNLVHLYGKSPDEDAPADPYGSTAGLSY